MQHALLRREADGFGPTSYAGLDDQPPFSRLFLVCGKAADVSAMTWPVAASVAMHCAVQPACRIIRGSTHGLQDAPVLAASLGKRRCCLAQTNPSRQPGQCHIEYLLGAPALLPGSEAVSTPLGRCLPQEELLVEAFQPFGRLQSVKLLRDKGGGHAVDDPSTFGSDPTRPAMFTRSFSIESSAYLSCCRHVPAAVAYVKYDRASSAAAAQEHLHETVLSDGRTKLKVMLAEAPHSRCAIAPVKSTCRAHAAAIEAPKSMTFYIIMRQHAIHVSAATSCTATYAALPSTSRDRVVPIWLATGARPAIGQASTWRWLRTLTTSRRARGSSSSSPRTRTQASYRCQPHGKSYLFREGTKS